MSSEDGTPSAIRENIKYLKRENTLKHIRRYAAAPVYCGHQGQPVLILVFLCSLCCSLVQANPDITMDCIIHMSQNITPSQRAKLLHLLTTMDNASNS